MYHPIFRAIVHFQLRMSDVVKSVNARTWSKKLNHFRPEGYCSE